MPRERSGSFRRVRVIVARSGCFWGRISSGGGKAVLFAQGLAFFTCGAFLFLSDSTRVARLPFKQARELSVSAETFVSCLSSDRERVCDFVREVSFVFVVVSWFPIDIRVGLAQPTQTSQRKAGSLAASFSTSANYLQ